MDKIKKCSKCKNPLENQKSKSLKIKRKNLLLVCPLCKYRTARFIFPEDANSLLIYCSRCQVNTSLPRTPDFNPSRRHSYEE